MNLKYKIISFIGILINATALNIAINHIYIAILIIGIGNITIALSNYFDGITAIKTIYNIK